MRRPSFSSRKHGGKSLDDVLVSLLPVLEPFAAGDTTLEQLSAGFHPVWLAEVDTWDWKAQGVLGEFFTSWDQTYEDPDAALHEIPVGELREITRQLLADWHAGLL